MAYKINPVIKYNEKIYAHMHNGFRFALVIEGTKILAVRRYKYELDLLKKANRGSKIVETKSLLREV